MKEFIQLTSYGVVGAGVLIVGLVVLKGLLTGTNPIDILQSEWVGIIWSCLFIGVVFAYWLTKDVVSLVILLIAGLGTYLYSVKLFAGEPKERFSTTVLESKSPKAGPDLRPGPNWKWPDSKWKQWCAEHSRDATAAKGCEGNAVFRRAAEQGVIGISDEERNKKLDEAWK